MARNVSRASCQRSWRSSIRASWLRKPAASRLPGAYSAERARARVTAAATRGANGSVPAEAVVGPAVRTSYSSAADSGSACSFEPGGAVSAALSAKANISSCEPCHFAHRYCRAAVWQP